MELLYISIKISSEEWKLVTSNNKFALKLYDELKSNKKNLFFSPFSISVALGMTLAGAKGSTAEQMASVLEFTGIPNLNTLFKTILKSINQPFRARSFKLHAANALWMQEDFEILGRYTGIISDSYLGGIFKVNFKGTLEAARQTINKWVEEKTNNKIKDLIKPSMIDSLTRLVLTNAIYFFSEWHNKFKKFDTHKRLFTLINGNKVEVPFMVQKTSFIYTENSEYQAIELPYRNQELSMVIFLPRKMKRIGEMEKLITVENLISWIQPTNFQEVEIYIPKFKIEYEFKLADTLKSMGMTKAFERFEADFTGIIPPPEDPADNLYISEVIHKAFVDVNEEGTEAAAATAVVAILAGAALVKPKPVPIFRADHPFMFFIRDVRTNSILFIGRILDPR